MKISIITVVYNNVDTIEQTIRSVLSQSYSDVEYIVIDACSTDGTSGIINKYIDYIDLYVREPDSGIYNAFNKGIMYATGDIIGIINADDWYEDVAIENISVAFEKQSIDIVYGNCNIVNEDKTIKAYPEDIAYLNWFMCVSHPTVFVRKSVYNEIGLFDETYRIASDFEFLLRAKQNGKRFGYIASTIANFRTSGISSVSLDKCKVETDRIVYSALNSDLFLSVLKKTAKGKRNISIFGAGDWGHRLLFILDFLGIDIDCFWDNDKKKWGQIFDDKIIVNPNGIKQYDGIVIIASYNYEREIFLQLMDYSLKDCIVVKLRDVIKMYDEAYFS